MVTGMVTAIPAVIGMARKQHALKAQKFIAWGNAPGTVPPHAKRAVGAKVAKRQNHGDSHHIRCDAHMYNRGIGVVPKCNAYGYFYRKQAAPRPSEQTRDARLALLLRLQRDNSLMVVYLGRFPRL